MSKRSADDDIEMNDGSKAVAYNDRENGRQRPIKDQNNDMGDFEDAWEDDFEEDSGDEAGEGQDANEEDENGMWY